MYMLDTNTCIFVLRNRPEKAKRKFKAIKNICISSVTFGELCLSPVGLSMVSKLSISHIAGLMMGMWFFFSGVGNYAAAEVGKLVGETGPLQAFGGVVIASFVSGIILFLIREKLVDWMHGAEDNHIDTLEVTASHEGISETHNLSPSESKV